ncbi:MAG TPA: tRNA lysidine(34) synthetase TilS [Candidatus Acidoferrales bacterium]|nr:tRNA lysidine(34) synthetase TilS [Candidatus Acidoferrales bacterium]
MKPTLAQTLVRTIDSSRMIAPGDRVGVAVSGGADSLALLNLLDAARVKLGITLIVVHFDHCLREESAEDARFVESLAGSRGLTFIGERANVAEIAAREKRNVEDAARRLRYEFFARVVQQGQATKIAVAHTMDDQAETVVARLLRGTGPSGLAGIYPSAGTVIRPLLGIRRSALREYLHEIKQEWREDRTNLDTTRQRSRIRATLLPLLNQEFSARSVEHLANLAKLSREEEKFWGALVEDRFSTLALRKQAAVSISVGKLLSPFVFGPQTPLADGESQRCLTERLVRRLYQEAAGSLLDLTSVHVEQVIRLAQTPSSGKRVKLPGAVTVERSFGKLIFSRDPEFGRRAHKDETQHPFRAYQYSIELSDRESIDVSVPEIGACFRLKVIDWPPPERETTLWRSILDFDSLRGPLVLRNWHAGDGYRPFGRRKKRKLKEMLLAARVEARDRIGWPVLVSGAQVVWAKGMDAAEEFCAREGTRAGVLIEECKL